VGISTLGLVVVAGRYSQIPSLMRVLPEFPPMAYETALAFVAAGLGLFCLRFDRSRAARLLGSAITLLGTLLLIGGATGGFAIRIADGVPMAAVTAVCFAATGAAILLASFPGLDPGRTGILSAIGAFDFGVGAVREAQELILVAERNVVRLIGLINDILDLERFDNGRLELQIGPILMESLFSRSFESVEGFAEAADVRLRGVPPALAVRGDGDRLVQVLVNLLSNAIKFSPTGSTVTVSAAEVGRFVEILVADRGRGVPAAQQASIFERFHQVEASDARQKGDTGLGLAICKMIIEEHGGTIGVESHGTGGSVFWFRVPVDDAAAIGTAAARRPLGEPSRAEEAVA
jgi:signal transduction histidine kinase